MTPTDDCTCFAKRGKSKFDSKDWSLPIAYVEHVPIENCASGTSMRTPWNVGVESANCFRTTLVFRMFF